MKRRHFLTGLGALLASTALSPIAGAPTIGAFAFNAGTTLRFKPALANSGPVTVNGRTPYRDGAPLRGADLTPGETVRVNWS